MKITVKALEDMLIELQSFYKTELDNLKFSDDEIDNLNEKISIRDKSYISLSARLLEVETVMLQVFGGKKFMHYFLKVRGNEKAEIFEND